MKIFPPQPDIGDEEGFTKEKDIFGREAFGNGLANLLRISEDPLVLALDGAWGSGKTTFIKMWAGLLRKENFPVIYFDAFANDFIDDAFLAIAGSVLSVSKELRKENTSAYKKYLRKASQVGRVLLRSGVKIGVKAATLGALEAADLNISASLEEDAAKETSEKIDDYIGGLLEAQQKEQKNIEQFRSTLVDLAAALSPTGETKKRPLIFIIDELDRCKPPFALDLLEKIKHVFSVSGIHFVLVTHLAQLENSVCFSYGTNIDARSYLQKFYSLIVHLPGDGKYENERVITKYLNHLATKMTLDNDCLSFVRQIARVRTLSFRPVEKICTYISLATAFTTSRRLRFYRPPPIVAGLCTLKTIEPALFFKAKSGELTYDEACDAFRFPWGASDRKNEWHYKWWQYCLLPHIDDNVWQSFTQSHLEYFDDREDIIRIVANHVIDRMEIPEE